MNQCVYFVSRGISVMRKIQEIKLNKYIELEPLIPMYCRGTVSIITEPDSKIKKR